MKVRVYQDQRKEFKNYPDSMSVYFPLPKRLRKREFSNGFYCAGHLNGTGFYGMYWDNVPEGVVLNSNGMYLGKLIKRETLPTRFQQHLMKLETLWNEVVSKDTDEMWDIWHKSSVSC